MYKYTHVFIYLCLTLIVVFIPHLDKIWLYLKETPVDNRHTKCDIRLRWCDIFIFVLIHMNMNRDTFKYIKNTDNIEYLVTNEEVCDTEHEDLKLINRKGSVDVDSQEKRKHIKEIENILSEIHVSLQHKKLDESDLTKVIQDINNEAKYLGIDNKILNLVHELIFVNFRKDLPLYHKVPWEKLFLLTFLAIIYICDIFANIILCIIYTLDKRYLYGLLTFIFYVFPSIFISYSVLKRLQILHYIRWICIICNLSPVLCCFQTINIANKIASKRKENDMDAQTKYYCDLRDSYEVLDKAKQFVGFLHCGPQLTFQLALTLFMCKSGICKTNLFFQLFLITTSLFGLIVAIETRFKGQIFEKLWLFPIIVARILSICILVFRFPIPTILFLLSHWLVITCWWFYKKAGEMEQFSELEKILFSVSEATVSTFIPIKFLETEIHLCLYVIHFIENILANVIWAITLTKFDHSSYIYAMVIGINITYFLFGISCKFIASKFTKCRCNNSIFTDDLGSHTATIT